jgi:fructose 1,6-bisphosphate aldolase/phosphatase
MDLLGSWRWGTQLKDGPLNGPRDMFDDPSFDRARQQVNEIMDYLRRHGPFEPHRLGLDEMEYTTMPSVAERLKDRWEPTDVSVPAITREHAVEPSAEDVE